MKNAFLKLDIFKKLPTDLTEPTFCGALGKDKLFLILLSSLNGLLHLIGPSNSK
jgi:hypothetical protein